MRIRITCAWCGKVIGSKENNDAPEDQYCERLISHSICTVCYIKAKADIDRPTRDSAPVPKATYRQKHLVQRW